MDSEEAHNGRGVCGAQCSNPAMSIIGAEDEDFENDLETTPDDRISEFNSIELVKGRPTHLLVFLHHVMLQFDCAPVLCYLHADLLRNLSAKETKKQFVEFYSTFLDKGAILRVPVPQCWSSELDRTRPDVLSEEQQRRCAQDVQTALAPEMQRQLEDFRQKRMMGMTPNEAELVEVESHYPTDRIPKEMKEKAVAENLLDKMFDIHLTIVSDEEKCSSIFGAVAFYMKTLGVKTRAADSKKSRGFFRRPLGGKTKKSEDNKAKQRFPSILSAAGGWMGGSTEVKVPKVEVEVEKEKVTQERKGSSVPAPSRASIPDATPPCFSQRKSCSSGGSASQPGTEAADGPGINISVTSSPDSAHSDMGLPSSRSDPLSVSDVGDVSPAALGAGLGIWEGPSVSDTPPEDTLDKDSVDGGLLPAECSGPGSSPSSPAPHQEEVEPRLLELEQDPPNWRELAPASALGSLSKKETKRQEVINELFATEHAHVRMLSVLQTVFSRPLGREELMTATELATIFPSLDEIIEMHFAFHESLKKVRQDDSFIVKAIGTTLLSRFGGPDGKWFQKLTARFCSHQSWALDQIKSRQKKDPRFNAFILEAECKPQCRRLQLKDIIPIEMQRLTKYPLLLENIAKSTEDATEKEMVLDSAECCRQILNHVNEEVKLMENLLTLKDYQRRLDTSGLKPVNELYTEYKNIDLTLKRMIYEGPLVWRVTKEKTLDVQCVLLGDLLVLFQRQDDKMMLKCQSKSNIAAQDGKQMLSPIIKLDSAFLREVATDRKAFYVIFTWDSGAQIYELVAQSVGERKNWTDVIKTAVDELKQSGAAVVDRSRMGGLTPVAGLSYPNVPPLSPTENGGDSLKNDRDKDSLTDEKPDRLLIDYLSDKGFDLIGHTNSDQEKVANGALDTVMSLKRLLVGSISLSEDSQPEEENGGEGSERQDHEADVCQSTEEGHCAEVGLEEDGGGGVEDGGMKGEEEESGISAPLVLSQERMEEVRRKLHSLEEQLKKLQGIEEEHHRLQEALSKFSLEGGSFQ